MLSHSVLATRGSPPCFPQILTLLASLTCCQSICLSVASIQFTRLRGESWGRFAPLLSIQRSTVVACRTPCQGRQSTTWQFRSRRFHVRLCHEFERTRQIYMAPVCLLAAPTCSAFHFATSRCRAPRQPPVIPLLLHVHALYSTRGLSIGYITR